MRVSLFTGGLVTAAPVVETLYPTGHRQVKIMLMPLDEALHIDSDDFDPIYRQSDRDQKSNNTQNMYLPSEKTCELLYLGQIYDCGNFSPKQVTIDPSFRTLNLQKLY
jgi:hypothetical protein